ncbi:MAG: response regulator [bacterium]
MYENEVEILLVEDNQEDAELTLRAFRKHNLANKVKVISDGEEAMDYIFTEGEYADREISDRPRVIFLDLKLPKVSGNEILKRIKSDERTKQTPVVVLTSSKEDKDLSECYENGANSYIVKPVDFDKFFKSVVQLGLYWMVLNEAP